MTPVYHHSDDMSRIKYRAYGAIWVPFSAESYGRECASHSGGGCIQRHHQMPFVIAVGGTASHTITEDPASGSAFKVCFRSSKPSLDSKALLHHC